MHDPSAGTAEAVYPPELTHESRCDSTSQGGPNLTVCVGIKVYDGLVFAADSATTLVGYGPDGETGVLNVWQHGNKVFNLHKKLPIAAMTAGMGHIGPASISTLTKDLRRLLTEGDWSLNLNDYTIEEVANHAHQFFGDLYRQLDPPPPNPHSFEFWIGGIGSDGLRGEAWKIQIENGEVRDLMLVAAQADDDRIFWGGQPEVINRLLFGFDETLPEALAATGTEPEAISTFLEGLKAKSAIPLAHAAMPVQDAIAVADFLVETTKRFFAFKPGADVVGGDTDIATVTKHEGFKWIRRKHYYPKSLNVETDHV